MNYTLNLITKNLKSHEEEAIIRLQANFKGFMARKLLRQLRNHNQQDQHILYKGSYKSKDMGNCHLELVRKENDCYQIVIKSVSDKNRMIMIQYTLKDFGLAVSSGMS